MVREERKLSYAKSGFTDEDISNLPIRESSYPYVEVDFSVNHLSSKGFQKVLELCRRCANLQVLKLFKNDIDDDAAEGLADLCKECPTLQEIHLSHNRFTEQGVRKIVTVAERSRPSNSSPLWLRLEYNEVSDPRGLFKDLCEDYRVCRRENEKKCTIRSCAYGHKVHLPFFDLQKGKGKGGGKGWGGDRGRQDRAHGRDDHSVEPEGGHRCVLTVRADAHPPRPARGYVRQELRSRSPARIVPRRDTAGGAHRSLSPRGLRQSPHRGQGNEREERPNRSTRLQHPDVRQRERQLRHMRSPPYAGDPRGRKRHRDTPLNGRENHVHESQRRMAAGGQQSEAMFGSRVNAKKRAGRGQPRASPARPPVSASSSPLPYRGARAVQRGFNGQSAAAGVAQESISSSPSPPPVGRGAIADGRELSPSSSAPPQRPQKRPASEAQHGAPGNGAAAQGTNGVAGSDSDQVESAAQVKQRMESLRERLSQKWQGKNR